MLPFDLKIEKSCKKVVESEWILVVFSSTKDDAIMIDEIWSEIVGENIWNRVGTLGCNQEYVYNVFISIGAPLYFQTRS